MHKREINKHIEKLKKELYTKSKDKYDLLYNNEVFTKFNKECDSLLNKINAKVIDIKKTEEKHEEKQNEQEKKTSRIENIIKRFQDMELARKIIMQTQKEDIELFDSDMDSYLNKIFKKYETGMEEEFNFLRNKRKTELVVFFNELNMAISKEKKEPYIMIEHINFRMNDLEEAVDVKKNEVKKIFNYEEPKVMNDNKVMTLVYKSNNSSKS